MKIEQNASKKPYFVLILMEKERNTKRTRGKRQRLTRGRKHKTDIKKQK